MLLDVEQSCLLLIDVQEKLLPTIYEHQRLSANCEWLLNLSKELKIPTLASEQYPKGLGYTVAPLKNLTHPENVVTKTQFSCAANESFQQKIKDLGKSQFIIAGIEAHVCVLQTVLELRAQNKQVFVVADAISSRNPDDKEIALQRMSLSGAHIITKEMVFFEWLRNSEHPKFKELSKQFMR